MTSSLQSSLFTRILHNSVDRVLPISRAGTVVSDPPVYTLLLASPSRMVNLMPSHGASSSPGPSSVFGVPTCGPSFDVPKVHVALSFRITVLDERASHLTQA